MCEVNCARRHTGGWGGGGEGDKRRKRKKRKRSSLHPSNAPLDIMLLCVDLVLRGKSLKWWKTTNIWHSGLMGPSSPPVRKWPTSALSSLPPAADWQSWVPAAPLPWRTTTSTTTTMTAATTGVSVTACAHIWVWVNVCALTPNPQSVCVCVSENIDVCFESTKAFWECAAGWLI